MTPPLKAVVRERSPEIDPPKRCPVTRIDYAGDEGGIICRLAFGGDEGEHVFFVSITHLTFDPRQPFAREIAAYQKHRVKRMRRLSSLDFD
ncbi:MAG: hypothetical protein GEU91_13485 [Rhizobiales bacterium]|nr:hypothetical protein [Hyphomicrobiales bacterium]